MSCCASPSKALSTPSNSAAVADFSNNVPADPGTKKPSAPSGKGSLYRRPLPDTCIALSSEEGQKRFASALFNQGLKSFFRLIEQFTTQSEPAFCGISTLVIILNALAVDPRRSWKGPWRWYEENMLNCGLNLEEVKQTGITMNEFRCLAVCQGLVVSVVRGDEKEEKAGLMKFRQAVQTACVKQEESNNNQQQCDKLLVASYSRRILGQTGTGHFSPIAAYDSESDSVLVLDTARFKYGAHWVSLPLLFEAMQPIDPDTGRSRGYVLLCDHDQGKEEDGHLLPSLLFRSQRKQNPIRREYKEFLVATQNTGQQVDFDQVASFWTHKSAKQVWKMMEPQLTPLQGDESAANTIASVRGLMKRLLQSLEHKPLPSETCQCRVNFARTLDLSPREAIFVVYLASLDEQKRREVVMQCDNPQAPSQNGSGAATEATPAQTPAQTQLLSEAELVRYAIDMSDELDGRDTCAM